MEEADWADDVAATLFDEFMGSDVIVDPTAKALRKAKADGEIIGLKRATDYIESHIRMLERGASEE